MGVFDRFGGKLLTVEVNSLPQLKQVPLELFHETASTQYEEDFRLAERI
jgi:hypothetical protein